MSLRRHLLVVTAATLAAGMITFCLAGNLLLGHAVTVDEHQRLDARLQAIVASLSIDRTHRIRVARTLNDDQLDNDAWIFGPSGRVLEAPSGRGAASTAFARRLVGGTGARTSAAPGDVLLGARALRRDGRLVATVVAGVSVGQLRALRRDVLLGSIAIIALTLIVGLLAIRRALSAALAPVERMTREAAEWGAHDLDRRFALGPGRDEITALAGTLDELLERIASSRRHEQRFAAEVAHELRTPLAAIRGTAELAADAGDLVEARDALDEVVAHSRRMGTTLDTLISFARRESSPSADGVDLEQVARGFEGVEVRSSERVPRAEGDPELIRQTLAPLVDNARRHALTRVTIELSGRHDRALVTVRDDGPGVETTLGSSVFLPGVRGAAETGEGAGLGLPLAQRLARSCGGELTLGSGPGGCFTLSLPVLRR